MTKTRNGIFLRMKPYIQPFEKSLALQEVEALAGLRPIAHEQEETNAYRISKSALTGVELAKRLAYWESVADAGKSYITTQSLRESTVNVVRNGIALDEL